MVGLVFDGRDQSEFAVQASVVGQSMYSATAISTSPMPRQGVGCQK
jgi:hypothetical protein